MIIKPSDRIGKVETYYFARKLAEIAKMNADGAAVINLGIGSPDLLPPKAVLESLCEKSNDPIANKYQSYKGLPELRKAFASFYQQHFDVSINPDSEVLPLIGSKEGIMHIAMTFLQEGDEVLVPNPGYPAYSMTTKLAGATPVLYDLKAELNWKPDLEELAKRDLSKVKIMWLNYPNMPTGASVDMEFFESLVEFAKANQILLCHDNPYGFVLNKNPMSLLQVVGAKEVAIELNSLSKCFNMAGWRVGAMLGNADYINAVMKFKSNMDSGMYRPVQEAAVVALSQGQEWFESLNRIYESRRKEVWKLMDLLECTYDKASSGMFVWGEIPKHISSGEAYAESVLQKAKVFITPGFIFGSNGDRYIRISLCSEIEIFQEAKNRIAEYLEKEKIQS